MKWLALEYWVGSCWESSSLGVGFSPGRQGTWRAERMWHGGNHSDCASRGIFCLCKNKLRLKRLYTGLVTPSQKGYPNTGTDKEKGTKRNSGLEELV